MELSSKRDSYRIKDRLSGLPIELQHHILSRMPIYDAARTSILSRNWRFIWTKNPKIIFGARFIEDSSIRKKDGMSFAKIVSDVLLMHEGPVREFSLCFPFDILDLTTEIDLWLLFLSKNGIIDLELNNQYLKAPYKLPSHIFLCKKLKYLSVTNCMFKTPHGFEGFRNLVQLYLENVSVDVNVSSNLLLNARELKRLALVECTGIQHLIINAPKLCDFFLFSSEVNWQWFERDQQLKFVNIYLTREVVQSTNGGRLMNLEKLIMNLSRVCTLQLIAYSLQCLGTCHVSARLPTPAENLKELTLWFPVSDLDQISCCLCLLRSSPNLEKLRLNILDSKINKVDESVMQCLEASNYEDVKLEKLKRVNIENVQGNKVELFIVKLLLGCAMSIEKMIIGHINGTDISDKYRVATEVSRFSRASPKAEVIFSESGYPLYFTN